MGPKIGFIGLGIMGIPMCKNLLKAGFDLTVYNRTQSKMNEILQEGAKGVSCPKEVAISSDIIIIMVTDSPDVEDVILGQNGIIEAVKKDSIIIDMSTISPKITKSISQQLSEKEAHMLDAPVSGGLWGAISGTLTIMVGGEEDIFSRALPVFEAMGENITLTGPSGMGQTTKLINQILVSNTMNAVAEALVFAAKAGANLDTTIEAVSGGAASSWQLSNLGTRAVKGDFSPGFMVKLQQKDLRLVLEMARELNIPVPSTSLVHQLYSSLEAEGRGNEGTQSLVRIYEKLAGVEARSE